MKQLLVFPSVLLFALAIPAFADIARPNPAPSPQRQKLCFTPV